MVDNIGVFKIKGKDRRVYRKDEVYFYYNDKYKRVHIDENRLGKKVEKKIEKKTEKKTKKRISWEMKECVCGKCGKKSKSYYKDLCIKCYIKEWKKKNPDKVKDYIGKYNSKKGGLHKSFTLFSDICPKCKVRGRFRLHITRYGYTGKLSMYVQVSHLKYANGKKSYLRDCYLGMLDRLQEKGKFLHINKEKYVKIIKKMDKVKENET